MTMSELSSLILAWVAGVALGAIFFGGLWWTVRKGLRSTRPALWFFGSTLVRTGVALSGFYVVSGGHWQRMLTCLLGFVMARVAVTRWTRPSSEGPNRAAPEARHAP